MTMTTVQAELPRVEGRETGLEPETGAVSPFLTTLWFGLLAGWLELGLVEALGVLRPHVSMDTLRINRHHGWMVPVSDLLIFGAVGAALALLARLFPRSARWTALRLPPALVFLALLLNVRGLYASASVVLAAGLARVAGGWLERRSERFGRLVRVSLPALGVVLAAWAGLNYYLVTSAERRALAACPPARAGAPNVLLIVLDTVRASCLSLYGHGGRPTTPNLDRLASRGTVFSEARSTAPWTSPTHGSIMTGRWAHELSVAPDVPLDSTFPTLAEVLGRQGYATAGFVGNVYYCSSLYGIGRGFARYEDAYENQTVSLFETVWSSGLGKQVVQALGYPMMLKDGVALGRKTAEMLNQDVLDWFDSRPPDRPFFTFINYYDVHRPYFLPEDPGLLYGMAALPQARRQEIDDRFQDLAEGRIHPSDAERRQVEVEAMGLYHDMYDSCLAYLDREVGHLLDELEGRGVLENTLVIVTSDHGEQIGEHGMLVHGGTLYRQEVHVPLVVVPPSRRSAARVVDEPVSVREIAATVAEWVNLAPDESPFPGRSLTRFLRDGPEGRPGPSPVLCELEHNVAFPPGTSIPPRYGPTRSLLVSRGLSYIRGDDGDEELYDLRNDPWEENDLSRRPGSGVVLDQLRAELQRLRDEEATSDGP